VREESWGADMVESLEVSKEGGLSTEHGVDEREQPTQIFKNLLEWLKV